MPKSQKTAYLINLALAILVFIAILLTISLAKVSTYWQGVFILVGINSILAISLNLSTGILGQLCLGHAGFMAIGAYTSALFTKSGLIPAGLGFPLSLVLAVLVTAVFGVIVGIPALRLKGDYLAIITLAFGQIISIVIRSLGFTGGAKGLIGISQYTNMNYTYWLLILSIYLVYALIRSRQGRAILTIREDQIASAAAGVNVMRYKIMAFVISAAMAGLAGGLFAHYQGILAPEKFDFNYSIDIMVMVVLGGMGSMTGSILSATALTIIPEKLRDFAQYRMLIYALVLILLMIFRPQGLLGNKEISQKVFRQFFQGKEKKS